MVPQVRRSLDPALVWEELRSILKGACLDLAQPMLDEAAYFELGRKRAPLFVDERPEIYRIAQRYQEWLAEEGRSDRIDLCRRAFASCATAGQLRRRGLRRGAGPDRAGGGLRPRPVAPAGPDGRAAHRRHAADRQSERLPLGRGPAADRQGRPPARRPDVLRLRRNLRSVRPLVELANALLLLRREVFGRTEEDEPEEAAIEGPVPVEVRGRPRRRCSPPSRGSARAAPC